MAQKFIVPISIKQLASAGSDALTVFLDGETYGRVKIEGGGRISWSSGAGVYDTNLYRDSANILATDDVFKAIAGIVTQTNAGVPTSPLPDGALAVDTTNDSLYFRSGGEWLEVASNATSVIIQSSPPTGQSEGTLWLDTDTLVLSIFYNNNWEPVSGESSLAELTDVSLNNLQNGQILKYSSASSSWYNEYEAIQNVDGGAANTVYGGIIVLSGGGASG